MEKTHILDQKSKHSNHESDVDRSVFFFASVLSAVYFLLVDNIQIKTLRFILLFRYDRDNTWWRL